MQYENCAKEFKLKKMKKLTCHCGGVEIQVRIPEEGFKKIMRCNCSLCKRKGYIIGVIGPDDLKIVKGESLLKLYQYHLLHSQLLEKEIQLQLFVDERVKVIS